MYASAGAWQHAHQAMLVAAGFYQIDVPDLEPSQAVVSVLPSLPAGAPGARERRGWHLLQGLVMADLLAYARASHDAVRVSR